MADHSNSQNHENKDTSYIKEKIVKKPRSKWFYVRRFFFFLILAVIFGSAAGAAFAVVRGCVEQMTPAPEEPTEGFTLARDEQPTEAETTESVTAAPETTEAETMPTETQAEEEKNLEEHISDAVREAMEGMTLNQSDMLKLERLRSGVFRQISNAFVELIVTHQSERDWFDQTVENTGSTFGVVVQMTDTQISMLTDSAMLEGADSLTAVIGENEYPAEIREQDSLTGITLVTVSVEEQNAYPTSINVAELGNSYSVQLGDMVIAAGSPMGFPNSVSYGYISYINKDISVIDGYQTICYTDMDAVENSGGVLLNMQGQIIGWITEENKSSTLSDRTAAIGISDLKYIIEDLLAGRSTAYLGVKGLEVDYTEAAERGVTPGFDVTEVVQGSPAYGIGIQPSDIIVQIGAQEILGSGDFQKAMDAVEAGTGVPVIVSRRNALGEYQEETMEITFTGR